MNSPDRMPLRGPEAKTALTRQQRDEKHWREIGRTIREFVEAKIAPLQERLAASERSLAAMRAEFDAHDDKGTWTSGRSYARHNHVTHDGSYWVAKRATQARPGDQSGDWRLVAKRGARR